MNFPFAFKSPVASAGFYAFDKRAAGGRTRGSIDSVDYVDILPGLIPHLKPTNVPRGAPILLSGWTIDELTSGPAKAVCVLLDGLVPYYAKIGIARGDVMRRESTDEFVGYQISFETATMLPGQHGIQIFALSSDGLWYESGGTVVRIFEYAMPVKAATTRSLVLHCDYAVDSHNGRAATPGIPMHFGGSAIFTGWTIDVATRRGAAVIIARDSHGHQWSGPANMPRPDVSSAFQLPTDLLGFEIAIPSHVLGRGMHEIEIFGVDSEGQRYANTEKIPLEIGKSARPYPLCARKMVTAIEQCIVLFDSSGAAARRPMHVMPAPRPLQVYRGGMLTIDGWLVLASGKPADDIFFEVSSPATPVPPRRYVCSLGGLHYAASRLPRGSPFDKSRFSVSLPTEQLPRGLHLLEIVAVDEDENTASVLDLGAIIVD